MKSVDLYKNASITDIYQLLAIRANRKDVSPQNDIVFQYKVRKNLVTVTMEQFWSDVHALRAFMLDKGVAGGRVAVLGENSYYWIISYFAAIFADAVVVPLDKDQDPADLAKLLKRCHVNMLLCSESYQDVGEVLFAQHTADNLLLMNELSEMLSKFDGFAIPAPKVDPDAVCAIIFTSGTTGEPKGVMLTQRGIAFDAISAARSYSGKGSSILTLPLHHTFGLTVGVLSAYTICSPIFISKSLRTFMKDMKEFKPMEMAVVPLYVESMYKNIWQRVEEQGMGERLRKAIVWSNRLRKIGIDIRRRLFSTVLEELGGNLRYLICGGAFLDQQYIDGMDDLGIIVLNGYGITECSPVVALNRMKRRQPNSIGLPLPGCEVRIEHGEICVRGDNVMKGYFEDEESTAGVLKDGWFHTGDLGHIDTEGFLHITGRKKNLIILSNGENVSAEELEEHILRIENVDEVVVSQEAKAIVAEIYAEVHDGIEEAVEQLNRCLPVYKRIGHVRFRNEKFERTTSQKIKRFYESNRKDGHKIEVKKDQ